MEKLHKDFLKELRKLLAKYEADISLGANMYSEEVIQIDFYSTENREYSKIKLDWIDKDSQNIVN